MTVPAVVAVTDPPADAVIAPDVETAFEAVMVPEYVLAIVPATALTAVLETEVTVPVASTPV